MRSLAKKTKDTNTQRMPMLQAIRDMLLLSLVMVMMLILVADARSINPLQNSASARGHAIGKREAKKKNVLSITNFSNDGMKYHLSNRNLAIVEELDISHSILTSVKFLEGLNFPVLKSIKLAEIEPEPSKTNIIKRTRPTNVNLHINWCTILETLEISTDYVFEGINSLVEKTNNLLTIPFPVFLQMRKKGPIKLKAATVKFTHVKVSDLLDIKKKSENGKLKNTAVKSVLFVADDHMGPLKGEIATEIINEIFAWVRVVFKGLRCINIEEKDFAESTMLKRIYSPKPLFWELPDLRLVSINNMIMHIKPSEHPTENFEEVSDENLYKQTMIIYILNINGVRNVKCLEVISTKKLEEYLEKNQGVYVTNGIIASILRWQKLDKKESIADGMK